MGSLNMVLVGCHVYELLEAVRSRAFHQGAVMMMIMVMVMMVIISGVRASISQSGLVEFRDRSGH